MNQDPSTPDPAHAATAAPRLLILGQTPPPWHGQAVATKMLFDHDWGEREVTTLRMAYSDEMHSVGRFELRKIRHLLELIRKTRRILKEHPDTILFYPPASAHWVPFLRDVIYLSQVRKKAHGTIFIFHASGLAEWISRSRLRRWLARRAYHHADLALEVAVEQVPPHEVFHSSKWNWCPCAAEVPLLERKNPGVDRPLNVLFVGSLQEGKGVLEIIRTAAILKQRGFGLRFRISIVGRWFSEDFKRDTEHLVAELDVEDVVALPGELTGDSKWQAYRDADVFFFPSHYQSEASPIVLMEALGAGLPIVSTKWRGIPSLVEGCESAWLRPVRDPAAYASALIELDGRRAEFMQFAASSRNFFEARYRPQHFTGRIEKALEGQWPLNRSNGGDQLEVTSGSGDSPSYRILQVFNQYAEQGGEEVWVDQVTSLSDERLRIHELRFQSRAWKMRGAPSALSQALRMWDNPESRRRLSREVRNLQPDVLLFHNLIPVASFGMYDEARKLGVPVLQYIHNFRPFSPSGTMWHGGRVRDEALHGNPWPEVCGRAWERSLKKTAMLAFHLRRLRKSGWLDAVDRWIAISEFMRDKFVEAGIPESQITTLRHCWTPMNTAPLEEDRGYYLFLGRLVPEKGVGTLLEAWQTLERRLGPSCPKLVIAGTGPVEIKVMAAAARNGMIEYVGFVSGEAKHRLLAGCRAVLAPSIWWEPLGLIVYEAYDYGKPVIAARSGGLVETVQEGEGGFLHAPGDPASFIDAILKLEETGHAGRVVMGMTGRKWLLQKASPDVWKSGFSKIVESVLR
jgi:glycosyltransferase involved in cell wall biosynthesis